MKKKCSETMTGKHIWQDEFVILADLDFSDNPFLSTESIEKRKKEAGEFLPKCSACGIIDDRKLSLSPKGSVTKKENNG